MCTSTITVYVDVDVDVDVLVHVDVFLNSSKGVEHTPETVKLPLPPPQSRAISRTIRITTTSWHLDFALAVLQAVIAANTIAIDV